MSFIVSPRSRLPVWKTKYRSDRHFSAWHAEVMRHDPSGNLPALDAALLNTLWATNGHHPCAPHILNFELNTILGNMHAETTLDSRWLDLAEQEALGRENNLWYNLPTHYQNHGCQSYERPILNACAMAFEALALQFGVHQPRFFPGRMTDEHTYGMLAISALILAADPDSNFTHYFYCPDAPQKHALAWNIEIPSNLISTFLPPAAECHGVRIGVSLGNADTFLQGKHSLTVPILLPDIQVSTVFAPAPGARDNLTVNGFYSALHFL